MFQTNNKTGILASPLYFGEDFLDTSKAQASGQTVTATNSDVTAVKNLTVNTLEF